MDRVNKLRDNKLNGKVNQGDTTMQFGKLKARGYSALPNFGVNYFVPMDVSKHKASDLPKVGDTFTLDVVVTEQEDGTVVNARPVINRKTKSAVTNCFWASLPKA